MATMTTSVRPVAICRPRLLATMVGFLGRWPVLSVFVLLVLIVSGAFAPLIAPHDPLEQTLADRNAKPVWYVQSSGKYLLGADQMGRDLLSRLIHGARISLFVMAISLVVGMVLGTGMGLIAGYIGGNVDELLMRFVDVWWSIPFLLQAMVVAMVIGQSIPIMMGLLALLAWTGFVRNVRAEVLSLKTRDYVALARVAGASDVRIMLWHILPGVMNTVIVIATLRVSGLILAEASLSFLGAGIPSPTPTWGLMAAEGRSYMATAWWISFFPGLAIFLVVMSLNFLGDWLRDRMDPRLRQL